MSEPTPSDSAASTSSGGGGTWSGPPKRRGFIRRHPALLGLALILVLLVAAAGSYVAWLNNQLNDIQRFKAPISEGPKNHNETNKPLNILLLGADDGKGQSVAQDLKDGKWTPFLHRSDTIIIVHISANRKSVDLVSIPRDTWVPIKGYPYSHGHGKINAAFAYGGPALALPTVEHLTGVHIDHMAIIDYTGFKDLTTALGGVRVYVPHTFYDDSQRITWHKGWHNLQGKKALAYVRTRHGLANGDFGRIMRQQNFMRATMGKLLSSGTTRNPIRLAQVVSVITHYITVDSTWQTDEIRNLALSLRNITSKNVHFYTAPLGHYAVAPDGEDIVKLAKKQSAALFKALRTGNFKAYNTKYPGQQLGGKKSVD